MDADVVCVGFGPATGGFLTTLSRAILNPDGTPRLESRVSPGLPLQVLCFERADDLAAGVSGIVTRAKGIRASFPEFDGSQVPLAARVTQETLVYLLDPIGASRRSRPLHAIDRLLRATGRLTLDRHACRLPYVPGFLAKHDGFVMSMGQFSQWVANEILATGAAQIWPASPVSGPLFDGSRVIGVRLVDQGTDANGRPEPAFAPGMDVHANLTVVGDGPVGPVGRALDARFGMPPGRARDEWALGMKMVVDLREDVALEPGTVIHTFGFPEPEIFGFLYALSPRTVSLGVFVPSWFQSPVRTGYRYLQHWMMHPYLWRWLQGGRLRSWGAKSILETGCRGEPYLVGDGFARIGEGSGSTNALTGSGVDEAWTTGVLLAEAVIELASAGTPFTRASLERTYVARRRASWVHRELVAAEGARDGFEKGLLRGLLTMGVAGVSGGRLSIPRGRQPHRVPAVEQYFAGRIPAAEIASIRAQSVASGRSMHDALMDRAGWPAIPLDGQLLVTHQDALLMGGKVQAAAGYASHVQFTRPWVCKTCESYTCAGMCSGQAIVPAAGGGVAFDREKCVHCGACLWNCAAAGPTEAGHGNIRFTAGAGGLHSVEN